MFPNSKPGAAAFDLYGDRLKDIPAERLTAAAEQCAASCRFFPTLAEIREAAGAVTAAREEVGADMYGAAVRECARALSAGEVPRLDSITRECVAGMGGAWALVYSQQPDTTRAHFLKAYEAKMAQERTIASVVPVARRLCPGPAPREIGPPPGPRALPAAPPEPPLSPREAAAFIAQIRALPTPPKMEPHPASDLATRAVVPAAPPVEPLDFTRCGACGLEYPGEGRGCPRCALRRQLESAS